jgi:hypothetical protein
MLKKSGMRLRYIRVSLMLKELWVRVERVEGVV